jgi:hypothetical protein
MIKAYILAMPYEIILVSSAKEDLKRLRGNLYSPFRLRVDEYRVYYDVDEAKKKVVIYGVIRKEDSEAWLAHKIIERKKE